MRFKTDEFRQLVKEIVRSEIKEVVTQAIAEVLSERYLRKLVSESAAAARPRGVSSLPIMGDDEPEEQPVPQPLENSILGVGQEDPVFKKVPSDKRVRQANESTERNEMLGLFFEGTKPLRDVEASVEEGLPLPVNNPEVAEAATRWRTLLEEADKRTEMKRQAQPVDPSYEEERLKRKREQLEVKVG